MNNNPNDQLNVPPERQHAFNTAVFMIELRLLDIQIALIAHKHVLRSVRIDYRDSVSDEELKKIGSQIDLMYDMLESFAEDYNVPKKKTSLRNELMTKASFLLEDLTGTISLKGHGHGDAKTINNYIQKMNQFINSVNNFIEILK